MTTTARELLLLPFCGRLECFFEVLLLLCLLDEPFVLAVVVVLLVKEDEEEDSVRLPLPLLKSAFKRLDLGADLIAFEWLC